MVIRVRKQDSAYFYQILESYEGLANYSTLPFEKGDSHRDIALHLAPNALPEIKALLEQLKLEIPLSEV